MEKISGVFCWLLLISIGICLVYGVPACDTVQADVIFLIDASGSVRLENFKKQLGFVADFSNAFDIGPSALQVGVITFSDTVIEQFNLLAHSDIAGLTSAIKAIIYTMGSTFTDLGLEYIRQNGFTSAAGDRPGAPNIVILLTDGKSNEPLRTKEQAELLRNTGVEIYAIGIGSGVNSTELDKVATNHEHVFIVDNFDRLAGFITTIKDSLCQNLDPCSVYECHHGGTCQKNNGATSCQCVTGYTGEHCDTDIDECVIHKPCQNGASCANTPGNFSCQCSAGYEGNTCQTDIDECATSNVPCENVATCVNTFGSYKCKCISGYEGQHCQSECDTVQADVIFLIDASGSVQIENFKKELEFAADFSSAFDIGPSALQVGVITFSETATEQFNLQAYSDKADVISSIKAIFYTRGSTFTNLGLEYIRQNGFTSAAGDRPGAPNIVILLTDGKSNEPVRTKEQAELLRNTGVEIYAIGIGSSVNSTELDMVATNHGHVFMVENFDRLTGIIPSIKDRLCQNLDPCYVYVCHHGGTCQKNNKTTFCQCATGYTGEHCDTVMDECASHPCQNGGTCIDLFNDYNCTCRNMVVGKNCEIDLCADIAPNCGELFNVCIDQVKRNTICRGTCDVCGDTQVFAGQTQSPATANDCRDVLPDCGNRFGACRDRIMAEMMCQKTCGVCKVFEAQIVIG